MLNCELSFMLFLEVMQRLIQENVDSRLNRIDGGCLDIVASVSIIRTRK